MVFNGCLQFSNKCPSGVHRFSRAVLPCTISMYFNSCVRSRRRNCISPNRVVCVGSFRQQFEISLYPRLSSPVPVVESTSQTDVTPHHASSRHAPPGGPAAGPSPPGGPAAGPSPPGGPAAGPRPEVGRSPPEPAAFHRPLVGLVRKNDFCVHPRQPPTYLNLLFALTSLQMEQPDCQTPYPRNQS